jgi:hypothetical protein
MPAILDGRPIPPGAERALDAALIDIAASGILAGDDDEFTREFAAEMGVNGWDAEGVVIAKALEHARSLGLTRAELNELRKWIERAPNPRPEP